MPVTKMANTTIAGKNLTLASVTDVFIVFRCTSKASIRLCEAAFSERARGVQGSSVTVTFPNAGASDRGSWLFSGAELLVTGPPSNLMPHRTPATNRVAVPEPSGLVSALVAPR